MSIISKPSVRFNEGARQKFPNRESKMTDVFESMERDINKLDQGIVNPFQPTLIETHKAGVELKDSNKPFEINSRRALDAFDEKPKVIDFRPEAKDARVEESMSSVRLAGDFIDRQAIMDDEIREDKKLQEQLQY